MAFRKGFLDAHQLRFEEGLPLAEDMLFLMEAYPHGKRFSFIPDTLYNYRWGGRKGSAVSSHKDLKDKLHWHFQMIDLCLDYWQRQGWADQYREDFVPWCYNFVMRDIMREETSAALAHLRTIAGITKTHHLSVYLEALSPSVYACFQENLETIADDSLSESEICQHLFYQMKILRLQMQNIMAGRRLTRLKTENRSMKSRLDQQKYDNVLLENSLNQAKKESEQLSFDLRTAEDANEQLVQMLRAAESEYDDLHQKLLKAENDKQAEIDRGKQKELAHQKVLRDLYTSYSWRIGNMIVRPFHCLKKKSGK